MRKFSFIESPLILLLNHTEKILPGIDKAIALFRNAEGDIDILEKRPDELVEPISVRINESRVNESRKQRVATYWTNKNDLPFSAGPEKRVQLQLEDEFENNVLVLKFQNEFDQLNDLFIVFFDNSKSVFGLQQNSTALSTESKLVIERMLLNACNSILEQQKSDKETFDLFRSSQSNATKSLTSLRSKVDLAKNNYKEGVIRFCEHILYKQGQQSGSTFILSDDARKKLEDFTGTFGQLEQMIEDAISIAFNRQIIDSGEVLQIEETDLIMPVSYVPEVQKGRVISSTTQSYDRYAKTIEFLDRYEQAAQQAITKNLPVTGQNIGNLCSPSISAAAIADVLKKHRNKILTLFDKYPERWGTIRSEFRSIKNLIEKGRGNQSTMAS